MNIILASLTTFYFKHAILICDAKQPIITYLISTVELILVDLKDGGTFNSSTGELGTANKSILLVASYVLFQLTSVFKLFKLSY